MVIGFGHFVKILLFDKFRQAGVIVEERDLLLFETTAFLSVYKTGVLT